MRNTSLWCVLKYLHVSFEESKCIKNRVTVLVLNFKNQLYNWIFKTIYITDLVTLPIIFGQEKK